MKIRPLNIVLIVLTLALGVGIITSRSSITKLQSLQKESGLKVKPVFAAGTQEAFDYLSTTGSSTKSHCGLQPQTVDGFKDQDSIEGSCCGTMVFHRYQEQVEGLAKYSEIPQIPEDPYNIPVNLAKELFEYQDSITLNESQQETYDKAMEMSHEGGPCCCKCWRWNAFEGQAKYLITEEGFSSEQIAEIWDLEDGCGGAGHVHDS